MASNSTLANRLAAGTINQASSWLGLPRWGTKLGLVAASGGIAYKLLKPDSGGFFAVDNARFLQITAMSEAMHDIEGKMGQLSEAIRLATLDKSNPEMQKRIIQAADERTGGRLFGDATYSVVRKEDMNNLYKLAKSLKDLPEYLIQKTYTASTGAGEESRPEFKILSGVAAEDKEMTGIAMLRDSFQSMRHIAGRSEEIALAIKASAGTETRESFAELAAVSKSVGRSVKRFNISSRAYYKEHPPTNTEKMARIARQTLGVLSGYSAWKFLTA